MTLSIDTAALKDVESRFEALGAPKLSEPVNRKILHEAILAQAMWRRRFTACTKTRAEVHGTTKKSMPQKGTGGARHGAMTAPQMVGGGVAFGPQALPRIHKMNRRAFHNALLESLRLRLQEKKFVVISGEDSLKGKTKEAAAFFEKNNVKKSLVCGGKNSLLLRSARNLARAKAVDVDGITPYDVMIHEWFVLSKSALNDFFDALAGKKQKDQAKAVAPVEKKSKAKKAAKPSGGKGK